MTHDDDDMTMMMMIIRILQSLQSQVALATKFFMVATDICGSSVGNLLLITVLVSRNLKWFLEFWKICDP